VDVLNGALAIEMEGERLSRGNDDAAQPASAVVQGERGAIRRSPVFRASQGAIDSITIAERDAWK